MNELRECIESKTSVNPAEQRIFIEGQGRELPRCDDAKLASLHVNEGLLLKLERETPRDPPRGMWEELQRRATAVVTEFAEDLLWTGKAPDDACEVISLNVYIAGQESFWVSNVSHLGDLRMEIGVITGLAPYEYRLFIEGQGWELPRVKNISLTSLNIKGDSLLKLERDTMGGVWRGVNLWAYGKPHEEAWALSLDYSKWQFEDISSFNTTREFTRYPEKGYHGVRFEMSCAHKQEEDGPTTRKPIVFHQVEFVGVWNSHQNQLHAVPSEERDDAFRGCHLHLRFQGAVAKGYFKAQDDIPLQLMRVDKSEFKIKPPIPQLRVRVTQLISGIRFCKTQDEASISLEAISFNAMPSATQTNISLTTPQIDTIDNAQILAQEYGSIPRPIALRAGDATPATPQTDNTDETHNVAHAKESYPFLVSEGDATPTTPQTHYTFATTHSNSTDKTYGWAQERALALHPLALVEGDVTPTTPQSGNTLATPHTHMTKSTHHLSQEYDSGPCPIAPVATLVAEVSDMQMQRQPAKVFDVGTRVKVLAHGQWYQDGIVIGLTRSGGSGVNAGSMKVWYNGGRNVRFISPRRANLELALFQPGTCPPLIPFGAVGQLSLRFGPGFSSPAYVELYGGYLTWWDRFEDAQNYGNPTGSVRLDGMVEVILDRGTDEFAVWKQGYLVATFTVRETQLFVDEKPGQSLDKNDRLRWMWTFAFRAQVKQFTVKEKGAFF